MKALLTSDLHYGFNDKTESKITKAIRRLPPSDIMLIAGDLISNKQSQLEPLLNKLRHYHPDQKIGIVFGNHDYWSDEGMDFPEIFDHHETICKKHDVTILSEEPLVIDDVVIFGMDGWYGNPAPGTNDWRRMPLHTPTGECAHRFMFNRAFKQFHKILDNVKKSTARKKILVTHFDITSNHGNPFIADAAIDAFDYLLMGHTHQELKAVCEGKWLHNAGSDYNQPKYQMIEVQGEKDEA